MRPGHFWACERVNIKPVCVLWDRALATNVRRGGKKGGQGAWAGACVANRDTSYY